MDLTLEYPFLGPADVVQEWEPLLVEEESVSARAGQACARVDNKLYIFGGYDGIKRMADFLVLDTTDNTWSSPEMRGISPPGRSRIPNDFPVIANDLLLFGGFDGHVYYNDLHVCDFRTVTWRTVPLEGELPAPRGYHSASAVGDRLYLFGGFDGNAKCNDTHVLYCEVDDESGNIVRGRWERLETTGSPPSPRQGHSATVIDEKVYIVGGYDHRHRYLGDVHVLDTRTAKWSLLEPKTTREDDAEGDKTSSSSSSSNSNNSNNVIGNMGTDAEVARGAEDNDASSRESGMLPLGRAYHSASRMGKYLLIIGGFSGREYVNDTHILDTQQGRWLRTREVLGAIPSQRCSHAATSCNGKVYVLCGYNGVMWMNSCYQLSTNLPLLPEDEDADESTPLAANGAIGCPAGAERLANDMFRLCGDGDMADVKLVFYGWEFQAHRCVIATRCRELALMVMHTIASDYSGQDGGQPNVVDLSEALKMRLSVKQLLAAGSSEASAEVLLKRVVRSAMTTVMNHVYTDALVTPMGEETGEHEHMAVLLCTMDIAARLELERLATLVLKQILLRLRMPLLLPILCAANDATFHQWQLLEDLCVQIVISKYQQLVGRYSEELHNLRHDVLVTILRSLADGDVKPKYPNVRVPSATLQDDLLALLLAHNDVPEQNDTDGLLTPLRALETTESAGNSSGSGSARRGSQPRSMLSVYGDRDNATPRVVGPSGAPMDSSSSSSNSSSSSVVQDGEEEVGGTAEAHVWRDAETGMTTPKSNTQAWKRQVEASTRHLQGVEELAKPDFVVELENGELKVHRAMLCARSPYFAMMLSSDFKESQEGRLHVDAQDFTDIEAYYPFLRFLYSGSTRSMGLNETLMLMQASAYYREVNGLFENCRAQLEANLNTRLALYLLNVLVTWPASAERDSVREQMLTYLLSQPTPNELILKEAFAVMHGDTFVELMRALWCRGEDPEGDAP